MIIKHEQTNNEGVVEHRITIVTISKPKQDNINQELQWFGTSLGLFNLRDKDKSCFRLFIELLKAAKMRVPLSSDELAVKTNLSRGTVIHHLNKLMDAGIVITLRNKYMLRSDSLEGLVDELKHDTEVAFNNLKLIGNQIDSKLGI